MSLPRVNVRRISLDTKSPEYMQCSIDFCTELPNTDARKPEEFFKNYRILVVQCRSQKQANQIKNLKSEALAKAVSLNAKTNFSDYRIFSVNQKQMANLKDPRVTERAELCFSTDEVGHFEAKSKNLRHLSYVFVPFLSKEGARREADYGTPTVEIVFEKGEKKATALALVDKNTGQPHKGNAQPTPETIQGTAKIPTFTAAVKTKKGTINGEIKQLKVAQVPNITIHDNRIWDDLKLDNTDLVATKSTIAKNPIPTIFDPVADISELPPEKKSYFSDITFSTAEDQSVKIFFSVNFKGMAKDAALYPWLYENSNFEEELVSSTKIQSIKLYRRAYFSTPVVNGLGMPTSKDTGSKDEKMHLVASSDGQTGVVKPKVLYKEEADMAPKLAGSLEEVDLISGANGIKSFTATDYSANNSGGKHQYIAEIEVQESTRAFLNSKMTKISAAADTIKELARTAQDSDFKLKTPYFNEQHRKFLSSFESRLVGKISKERILESIEVYLSLLSDLTTKKIDVNVEAPIIWDLIAPENGTVDNILRFNSQIDELVSKLDNMLGGKGKQAVAGSEIQSMTNKKTASGLSTYTTTFEEVFTSSGSKPGGTNGYKFLPFEDETTRDPEYNIGPAAISVGDYKKAVQVQHDKLFKVEGNFQITENVVVDIEQTKPTYITPIAVKIDNVVTSLESIATQNVDRTNRILTEKLKQNLDIGNINRSLKTTEETTTDADYLTDNLIDLFASKGCTIEGVSSTSYRKTTQTCYEDTVAERVMATTESILDSVRAPKDKTTLDKEEIGKDSSVSKKKLKASKGLVNLMDILTKEKSPKWKKKGAKESDLNLNREDSVLKTLPQKELNKLPNQINAMMAIASQENLSPALNISNSKLSEDDKENNGLYEENLTNIREVQMLTGYDIVDGEPQMKSPVYKKVKQQELDSIASGKSAFCRTVKFTKPEVGITENKEASLPVINEAFIMKNNDVPAVTEKHLDPQPKAIIKRKDVIIDRKKILEPKIDPTQIFTDGDIRGTGSDPTNVQPKVRRKTPRPRRGTPLKAAKASTPVANKNEPRSRRAPVMRPTRPTGGY